MISTKITSELVTHTAVGDTQLTDLVEAMEAWYRHSEFRPEIPILWNVTEANTGLGDLYAFAIEAAPRVQARAGHKTAWVMNDSRAVAIATDIRDSISFAHNVRVFLNDIEAAIEWALAE